MGFAKYAALVKNLRGVVLADLEEEGVWESIEWLVKRFRYRNLGLVPSVVEKYRGRLEKYLRGNPFRELVPPVQAVSELVELLAGSGLSRGVSELLVYSSAYVSPALLLGESYLKGVENVASGVVRVCKEMDTNSWKLHLRIADYTILDLYEDCVNEALDVLEGRAGADAVLGGRRGKIERDKKRYWRISCETGAPFLYYVDVLDVAAKRGLLSRLRADHAAGLAIVPVVHIPAGLK